jgi:TolB-like protein
MKFLSEFKRRKVLSTASLYVLGVWVLLQVLEVLQQFFPASAMRWTLIGAAAVYPLVFLAGWFFDVSREGITRTRPAAPDEALPEPGFMDYVQLAGHALVIGFVGYILSVPPPVEAPDTAVGTSPQQRTIAVLAFEDLQPGAEGEGIGETLAGELRSSLTRVAGLRVLGPETSKALNLAGEGRLAMAKELAVTALVLGEILLDGGQMRIDARLVGVPAGNEMWSNSEEGPSGDGVALQQGLLRQIVRAIAPQLDPDPVQGARAEAGACSAVYDIYLRGKQLSKARRKTQAALYQRGMQLLREAVATDEQCALAWEAIAIGELEYTTPGFARAAAAARRALELNDALPEAWTVLAEVAEQERNWGQAEEFFLRALYSDPTNARANYMYGETLMARGRVKEGLRYTLEAYRYEPASGHVNYWVMLLAFYAGEYELLLEHAEISADILGSREPWLLDMVADTLLMKGDLEAALATWAEAGDIYASWFLDCARARQDPALAPDVRAAARESLKQLLGGTLDADHAFDYAWNIIRCGIWLEEPEFVFEVLGTKNVPGWDQGVPTEVVFVNMFHPDGALVRRDPRFRQMAVEAGLLDYWKQWGWADRCRPDGDSFVCD